jgi:hypothetical protein
MSRPARILLSLLGLVLPFSSGAVGAPQQLGYDAAPISYSSTPATDRAAALNAQIAAGKIHLAFDPGRGFLPSILKELDVPVSSQTLVFSKTSFQRQWINPRAPRAIYFNDDLYIGWVRGAEVLEVASQDPQLGTVFYTLEQEPSLPPRLRRQTDNCLQCHDSTGLTLGVPGVTVRSVFAGHDGMPHFNMGGFRTTYQSPFQDRWGGWYVTGTHGTLRHMGNITFSDDPNPDMASLRDRGANCSDLSQRMDVEPYLTPTSDIVALMVLEHQTYVHNLITRANHETRIAIAQSDDMNRALGVALRPVTEGTHRRIAYACEPLLEAIFYSHEAALHEKVAGNSTYAADFENRGPFDHRGRSLRQFDLTRRMFRFPLSYLVYSKAFRGLPSDARAYVSRRLTEILAGRESKKEFSHLSCEDRQAIREILSDTFPELLDGWK